MSGSIDGPGALVEDRRALDPIAALFGDLASDASARRWLLVVRRAGHWHLLSEKPSHLDDLYLQLAEAIEEAPSVLYMPTPELGSAGLRLDAAGVHGLGVVVFDARADAVIGFMEEPDRARTEALAGTLPVEALMRIGSIVPAMLGAAQRAAELEALARWLPALREMTREELDEAGALQRLAELLDATCVMALRRQGEAVDTSAAWRDLRSGWDRFDGVIHVHGGEGPLDEATIAAVAGLVGVQADQRWVAGTSGEARALTIAVAGGRNSREGIGVAASLMSAASKQGRDLSAARTNALLQERARIASMIHEGITQVLTNVVLQMELLDRLMDDPTAARKMITRLRDAVLEALDSLRGAILELTPAAPEWSDLAGGLERFVGDFAAQWGLEVGYSVVGKKREVDPEVLALIFGFVQEGLSNVRKHAEVSEAEVTLTFTEDTVKVEIADSGRGFEPEKVAEEGFRQHQGLSIMRSRARLAGASFDVGARDGGGTVIQLESQA